MTFPESTKAATYEISYARILHIDSGIKTRKENSRYGRERNVLKRILREI